MENSDKKDRRTVFVTVGTTLFDALVRAVDTWEVKRELFRKGYTHLLIQIGRGSYIPTKVIGGITNFYLENGSKFGICAGTTMEEFWALYNFFAFMQFLWGLFMNNITEVFHPELPRFWFIPLQSVTEDGSLSVEYFSFSSSIADHLRSASLVISHAGSGSIFETLRLGKPLIVVVNEDLMDNHQSELAEELAERRYLYCARPQTLHQTIANLEVESLLPYPASDATPVAKMIYRFLGFPDD